MGSPAIRNDCRMAPLLPLLLSAMAPATEDPPQAARPLPGYALGQPLAESRQVVPPGETRATWVLRCAGDAGAPAGLGAAPSAATEPLHCWPMRIGADGERRASGWHRHAPAVEDLEFREDRLALIRIVTRAADGTTRVEVFTTGAGASR